MVLSSCVVIVEILLDQTRVSVPHIVASISLFEFLIPKELNLPLVLTGSLSRNYWLRSQQLWWRGRWSIKI